VQKRIRKLIPEFMRNYKLNKFTSSEPISDESVLEYVEYTLGDGVSVDSLPEFAIMKKRVARAVVSDLKSYDELITFLVSHLQTPNLHWFYTATTIGLLEIVIAREIPVPASLMTVVMEKCLLSDIRAGIITLINLVQFAMFLCLF
jgi:hypothetical protein